MVPILKHPLFSEADANVVHDALNQHLFAYLTFTDRLEHEIVNETARRIAIGASGLNLPFSMRMDSYRVYCDEGYHSLFSADLMHQIQTRLGFQFNDGGGHPALHFFHSHVVSCEPEFRSWAKLFFVIVSETLISVTMSSLPKYATVMPSVRQIVSDHAQDEARHQVLFADLCELAWQQAPNSVRVKIGLMLPTYIKKFLAPNLCAVNVFLRRHLAPKQARQVLAESYSSAELGSFIRTAARNTIRVFHRAGVLQDSQISDSFQQNGFLVNSSADSTEAVTS
jgi:hypothetical protein